MRWLLIERERPKLRVKVLNMVFFNSKNSMLKWYMYMYYHINKKGAVDRASRPQHLVNKTLSAVPMSDIAVEWCGI